MKEIRELLRRATNEAVNTKTIMDETNGEIYHVRSVDETFDYFDFIRKLKKKNQ